MNSLQLIQRVCSAWLQDAEASALEVRDMESLLLGINQSVQFVWPLLPSHYRRRDLSFHFQAVSTGTASCTENSRTISALSVSNADFCSVIIDGDSTTNELRSTTALLHPYRGATGSRAISVYFDALKLSYNIDRFTAPVVCVDTRRAWRPVNSSRNGLLGYGETYHLDRIVSGGADFTVMRIDPLHDTEIVLESEGIVSPLALTLVDSMAAAELPYNDQVAGWIVAAAGQYLVVHPKFRENLAGQATAQANLAAQGISLLAPAQTSAFNEIGPPCGW